MLVRAAGRKQRRHTSLQLTQLADSLYLPFLCPAQLRWTERRTRQISQTRLQSSQVSLQARSPLKLQNAVDRQSRNLATVAESYQSTGIPQLPPAGISDKTFQQFNAFAADADLEAPFIELHEASRKSEDQIGRSKAGISGNAEDLLANIETNLRVERFDRCKRIINKLVSQDSASSYVPFAHNRLLEARLDTMQTSPASKQAIFEEMRQWFESEMVEKNVAFAPASIVAMIQGALQALSGPKQERAVRRFYELAVERKIEYDVINSEAYADEDLWRLAEIEPDFAAEELSVSPEAEELSQQTLDAESQLSHEEVQAHADLRRIKDMPGIFKHLPEIQDTDQKGEGLRALKNALENADEALDPAKYNAAEAVYLTPRQRQQKIEESSSEAAILRWKSEESNLKKMGIHSELDPNRPLGALMWQWYAALLPALKQELEECRKALNASEVDSKVHDERLVYGSHLESVPLQQVAATTILYIMSLVAGGKDRTTDTYTSDTKLARLSASLGRAMQEESEMTARKKADRTSKAQKKTRMSREETRRRGRRFEQVGELSWPTIVKVKLGAMLVSKLIETAKISVSRPHPRTKEVVTQLQPAFIHKTNYEHGRKQGYLSACVDLVRKMNKDPVGYLIAKRLPMVIEPEPWTDFTKGGYLYYPNPIIRFTTGDKVPRDYAHAAIQRGDLDHVFAALNALGKIPWQINEDVLRVQIDAWNSGEPIANFAPREPKKEVIPKPADETDMRAMKKWKTLTTEQNNEISGLHSQRCFQNFQLEIARAFRHEKIYFPHNIDFRGRAYPIPPYLNHMGADNARALMKFGNGKELGVEGLRWLKIHLANVFGYDKASLQEREDFVMKHLPEIYDSATDPLGGQKWWLQSEDAWQTLAACYELKHALDSPDPTKFVSTLPIHQDGTCNGLQHYAALGGDAAGARQVNLEPGDRPSDVYTAVADAVTAKVQADFDAGHPVAKILHGRITRKIVKQPVMTNVYGVTYYGARAQVQRQLEEIFPEVKRTDVIDHTILASYVTKKIFQSLGEMFRGAQAIQQWLGACADRISTCVTAEQIDEVVRDAEGNLPFLTKAKGAKRKDFDKYESADRLNVSKQLFRSSVIWTTPLRLPVVQPYRSTKRKLVATKLANLALQEPSTVDPVSKRKQLQGFPPNFIHSLDATHMMMSANKCAERNMTFASIHDSFWTHACDINDLSRILRDAFIEMHSEDIVGRLRHEFLARYKGAMYLAAVDVRSPVGKKILDYQRSRRASKIDKKIANQPYQVAELIKERMRLRLLQSEDPQERAEGEAMVTSGSIFAAEKDAEGALAVPNEIRDTKLGEIPTNDAVAKKVDADASELLEPATGDADKVNHEDVNGESDIEDDVISDETEFVAKMKMKSVAKKAGVYKKAYIWLPLQFPEVPEKGTFDVRRLKESVYFFH